MVSVDIKKEELVGRESRPEGGPGPVSTHDFADPDRGKAIHSLRVHACHSTLLGSGLSSEWLFCEVLIRGGGSRLGILLRPGALAQGRWFRQAGPGAQLVA